MVAIQTKWIGPTDTKGSRIKAFTCNDHSITVGYASSLSSEEAHKGAAMALCNKMGWSKENWFAGLLGGGIKNGYSFVIVTKNDKGNFKK